MRKETLSGILAAAFVLGMILCAVNIPAQAAQKCACSKQTDGSTYCVCVDDEGKTYCESCKGVVCMRVKCQ